MIIHAYLSGSRTARLREPQKAYPVVINRLLQVALRHKGDSLIEAELMIMCTIHCGEPLILKHEISEHNGSFLVRPRAFGIAGKSSLLKRRDYSRPLFTFRIGKNRFCEPMILLSTKSFQPNLVQLFCSH